MPQSFWSTRSSDVTGPAAQREKYRRGFYLFQDDVWQKINWAMTNSTFWYGFVMLDVPTLNQLSGGTGGDPQHCQPSGLPSTRVDLRAPVPRRLEVMSPEGFPPGITRLIQVV